MINFYELLGVSENSSKDEIKSAYRAMAKKYHPDINKSEEATKIIRSLNEAKEILLDDEKRKEYDIRLNNINNSKQFSKDKEETYNYKANEYKETYSDVYVSRLEYLFNYLKNGIDKVYIKIIKLLLVFINYIFFFVLKIITTLIVYILYISSNIIDFISGLLIIVGVISLFLQNTNTIQTFLECIFLSFLIEILKILFIKGSVNLYALFQKLHDKIFIKILMK